MLLALDQKRAMPLVGRDYKQLMLFLEATFYRSCTEYIQSACGNPKTM